MIDIDYLYSIDSLDNDRALDYLFCQVDDALFAGELELIEVFLDSININKISIVLGIGILSITQSMRSNKYRVNYLNKFEERLKKSESPERVYRLISGFTV